MSDDRAVQRLLEAADATAPRPPLTPVSLIDLHARLRRKRLRAAGLATVLVMLSGTALSLWSQRPARSAELVVAPDTLARQARRLRAELRHLGNELAALAAATEFSTDLDDARNRARVAVERSAMSSYLYGRRLADAGEPRGRDHLERLRRQHPDTRGARRAAHDLEHWNR